MSQVKSFFREWPLALPWELLLGFYNIFMIPILHYSWSGRYVISYQNKEQRRFTSYLSENDQDDRWVNFSFFIYLFYPWWLLFFFLTNYIETLGITIRRSLPSNTCWMCFLVLYVDFIYRINMSLRVESTGITQQLGK